MGMIQADFLGSLDLDNAGIMNNDQYHAEAKGNDLLPNQFQPGMVVVLCVGRVIFISQIHASCSINWTENNTNLHYVNRDLNVLFMFIINDLRKSVKFFFEKYK
jgi:hypothetical protein